MVFVVTTSQLCNVTLNITYMYMYSCTFCILTKCSFTGLGCRMSGLGDLPEQCVASILSYTSPKDIRRLALVSRAFLEASKSDLAWEGLLPPHWQDLFKAIYDGACSDPRRKLYKQLCDGVYIDGKNQIYMVDRATASICRMLSARAITIIWGEDQNYWEWQPLQGSRFEEVAYLRDVCWLELRGRLKGYWWPGNYKVSFRLKLKEGGRRYSSGWNYWPVVFSLSPENGPTQQSSRFLVDDESQNVEIHDQTPVREVGDGWKEYDIGEFVVEDADAQVEVEFSMKEIRGLNWKHGLYVDGVVIRPS